MKTFVPYIIANLVFIAFAIWVGCVPSGYQSPRVLRPGQASVGAGVAVPITYGDFSLCLRCGVIKNLDVGIKYGGSKDGYGVFSDIKYCFLKQPLLVAADVGFIYYKGEFMNEYEPRTQGVHPTILLGSDRFYGGIGWNYLIKRETHDSMSPPYTWDITTRSSGPRIMLGSSWGQRWKFNPEIIFNFDPLLRQHAAGVMIGCGIYRIFGKKFKK
ncbi:MAG: hypothetical protein ONB13_04460 [candidate division KSB1 bacterium]|nr:hypothetical protein [candidate division KSB1 bacterium]MDZ7336610.1 hypothetical protein [candidate division KSB1 bacterium]MDZ7358841.1 hypothetical protein [candidate division KSB1 bacterium]MDZ7375853.1 hypothetical protein [candidate division KSB1 bacterium]MDZ7399672.1 hypothetical protein [candidate division KSB1 bacterium]